MPDTVVVCMPRRIPLPSIGNFVLCFPHEMVQYSAGKSSEPLGCDFAPFDLCSRWVFFVIIFSQLSTRSDSQQRVVKHQRTPNKGTHSRRIRGFHGILEYSVLRRGPCLLSYFLH